MFCTNCGNQIDEGVKFCTVCGKPLASALPQKVETTPPANAYRDSGAVPIYQQTVPFHQQININVPQQPIEYKTKWETPRVVIGIITVVLFFLFQFQSCVAGAGETLQSIFSDSAGTSGSTGYVVSFFFLIAGIVSIVCRKSKGGSIAAGAVYAICGMALVQEDFSFFKDLAFYCFISFVFGGILIIGGALQKPRENQR